MRLLTDLRSYRAPAYLRVKGRARWEPAPAPALPHGERLSVEDQDVPLPVPVCLNCGDPIYYEKRAWHHRDPGRSHTAVADEGEGAQTECANGHDWVPENLRRDRSGKLRCRLCVQDRNREYRIRYGR